MPGHRSASIRVVLVAHAVLAVVFAAHARESGGSEDQPSPAQRLARTALLFALEGDVKYRDLVLGLALGEDPQCELAHWHMGQLRVGGRWLGIDEAERQAAGDPQAQQYRRLRDEASAHWKRELALARWCHRLRWDEEERLHLGRVLMNSASNQAAKKEAIRKLGLKLYGGLVVSEQDIQWHRQMVAASTQAMNKWRPRVKNWQKAIESGPGRRREYAQRQLRAVRDLAAIPALESLFSTRSEPLALEVTSLLKNMPQQEATQSVLRHAVGTAWTSVFEQAVEELKRRSLHEYAPTLLGGLVAPIQSAFRLRALPDGTVEHHHVFLREGAGANVLVERNFMAAPRDGPALALAGRLQIDRLWDMRIQAFLASLRARRFENTVAQANEAIQEGNERLYVVLESTTGMALPRKPSAWWDWWQEYNEVQSPEKPTYLYEDRRVKYYGLPMTMIAPVEVTSCFPRGTPVRTQTGLMAIENVKAGDRVLSQDPETGELAYKLVLRTTERAPSPLVEIGIGEIKILTTKGHPFWVNGVGWRMAKRLQAGDRLHNIRGGLRIDRIAPAPAARAYNLIVADFGTYFVSQADVLVHDNTYRAPTTALAPGLLPRNSRSPSQ